MLSRENAVFEEMRRTGYEWEKAREERRVRKQEIINTLGWDSQEMKAWYAEDEAAKFPFSQGANKAYRAWASSVGRQEKEVEMDDFLWDSEVADFVDTLRKAGFGSFVYTNQSTAVMENLHQFAAQGCAMQGLCMITRRENRWGEEEPVEIMGIRFILN